MSIDARVRAVIHNEDGSGRLELEDRPAKPGQVPGIKGQDSFSYETAPHEVTALNGLKIWGGANSIMLGDTEIATRIGYTRLRFCDDETFERAVKEYHRKHGGTS